jgi:magnesium chelatase family protein
MKYQSRISGPLLDRIDIQIEVPRVDTKSLACLDRGETSAEIRARVAAARAIQAERYRGLNGVSTNADVKSRDLERFCMLTPALKSELVRIIERLRLSARAYDKVLRVARTVADLAASEAVRLEDLAAAVALRRLDDEEYSFWV